MLAELLHLHLSLHSHLPFRITKGQVRTLIAESCSLCRGYFCLFVFSSGYWCFTPQSRKSTGANSAGQEISDNVLPHGGVLGRVCSPLHSLWSTCWCLFLLKDISFSPILSKPLPHTPPNCILSRRLCYSTGSTEDNWKGQ